LNIKEIIKKQKYIFHFNVSTLEQILSYCQITREKNVWLCLGASEKERNYLGSERLKKIIDFEREKGAKVFLNADHCKSKESAQEALFLGYDSITFDMSHFSFEENLRITKDFVEFAKEKNKDIFIEGELGNIKGKSEVIKESIDIEEEDLTDPYKAKIFVEETKVDALAISVGNLHGISTITKPNLDFERIKKIKELTQTILVLHGGSGIASQDIKKSIDCGINIVHINTELRICWRETLEKVLQENPASYSPYEILNQVVISLKNKALQIIDFNF